MKERKKLSDFKDFFLNENRKLEKDKRDMNLPLALSMLEEARKKKGKGYNSQLGYELVLNGDYMAIWRTLLVSGVELLFMAATEVRAVEEEEEFIVFHEDKQHLPHAIDVAEERVMRN